MGRVSSNKRRLYCTTGYSFNCNRILPISGSIKGMKNFHRETLREDGRQGLTVNPGGRPHYVFLSDRRLLYRRKNNQSSSGDQHSQKCVLIRSLCIHLQVYPVYRLSTQLKGKTNWDLTIFLCRCVPNFVI